ncbi:serine incorporator/TMS membrane protein [Chytriomyces sp. MP71]|nr:serine incorporator/TMS membrane protein [Chytriomyces sp. MP71]
MCGARNSSASRIGYALLFVVTSLLAYASTSDWFEQKLDEWSFGYLKLQCPQGSCYGTLSVYRICMANSTLHAILAAALYNVSSSRDWRANIQNGFWALKTALWAGLIVLCFFIPNSVVVGWAMVFASIGAFLFIIVQIVLLIDFAYTISEILLEWWEATEDRKFLIVLITLTFASFLASVITTGFLYAWFGPPSCRLNQFFITFNLVLCVLVTLLSIAPAVQESNPKSGIAQASMVVLYATYLMATSVSSEPDVLLDDGLTRCNPLVDSEGTRTTGIMLGALFTFFSLAFTTTRAAVQSNVMGGGTATSGGGEASAPLLSSQPGPRNMHLASAVEAGAINPSSLSEDDEMDDELDGVSYSYTFFHIIFMLGSYYLAELITNWENITLDDGNGEAQVGKGWSAVWVKVVSSWVVIVLYGYVNFVPCFHAGLDLLVIDIAGLSWHPSYFPTATGSWHTSIVLFLCSSSVACAINPPTAKAFVPTIRWKKSLNSANDFSVKQ